MGQLYVVSTPIGNLKDITLRAIDTLKEVDLIFSEDTRVTKKLLHHLGIKGRIQSLNEQNEAKKTSKILQQLSQGKSVALMSDAGTPLISDPGYCLVKQARENFFNIIPIPGCCAAIAALSVSGIATDKFYFHGFLPSSESAQLRELGKLAQRKETLIFYESVHRLQSTIGRMIKVFGGNRKAIVCKEITKLHESYLGENLSEINEFVKNNPKKIRGEFTIIIDGCKQEQAIIDQNKIDKILLELLPEMSIKKAVKICMLVSGFSRNVIYKRAVELKSL
tara:strand:+ start:112 stop:948 length:837 start_codon:yes stop_codon:yes gene_type:complete